MRSAPRLLEPRTRLALENPALRLQLAVYQRNVERPQLNDGDRMFWTMACEFLQNWKEHLVIVKPGTVARTINDRVRIGLSGRTRSASQRQVSNRLRTLQL